MIRKEALTKQDIKAYLKTEKVGRSMSMEIGIYVVSVAVFSISIMVILTPLFIDKNISLFWSVCIFFLSGIIPFVGSIIACLKVPIVAKYFPYVATIVAIVSAISEGGMALITPIILIVVLVVVYLLKLSKYQDLKSELALHEKFVFTGTLISAIQEQENVNYGTGVFMRTFWNLLVSDGTAQIVFKVSSEKLLGMFVADNQKLDLKSFEKKQVEASFLSPATLLGIVPLHP